MEIGLANVEKADKSEEVFRIEPFRENETNTKDNITSKRKNEQKRIVNPSRRFCTKKQILKVLEVIVSLFVRVLYIVIGTYSIYMIARLTATPVYWTLMISIVVIICEGLYVIIKRRGKEFSWFSLSCFSYTVCMIFTIWSIQLFHIDHEEYTCEQIDDHKKDLVVKANDLNITNTTSTNFNPFNFMDRINFCQLIQFLVSLFLISIIVTRWFLPVKSKVNREELSAMLITFIVNAADISKLMSYLDRSYIRSDRQFVYLILIFFTTSAIQFSFTLTSNRSKRGHSFVALFFGTEIWALCFLLVFQELPFLFIRSLKAVKFEQSATDYTDYFFAVKNFILCLFELYRIGVIYYNHNNQFKNKLIQLHGSVAPNEQIRELTIVENF